MPEKLFWPKWSGYEESDWQDFEARCRKLDTVHRKIYTDKLRQDFEDEARQKAAGPVWDAEFQRMAGRLDRELEDFLNYERVVWEREKATKQGGTLLIFKTRADDEHQAGKE